MAFENLILSLASVEKQADATNQALTQIADAATTAQSIVHSLSLGIPGFGALPPPDAPLAAAGDPRLLDRLGAPPGSDRLNYTGPTGVSDMRHTSDILPDSGGNAAIFGTFNMLIKLEAAISQLPAQIADATKKIDEGNKSAAQQHTTRFEEMLKQIADFGGYKLGKGGETGVFSGQELLEKLETLILRERQPYLSPQMMVAIQESITKILNLVRQVGGAAGRDFQLSQFERYVRAHHPQVSSGAAPTPLSIDTLLGLGQL